MPYIVLDPALAAPAPTVTAGDPLQDVGTTLAVLDIELMAGIGNRTDAGPERRKLWINDAYLDVASSVDLDVLHSGYGFQTIVGQPLYLLPECVHSTEGIALVGMHELEKTDLSWYRRAPDIRGTPRSYFRRGNILVLYPTPGEVLEVAVDFRVRPLDMVEDEHSPMLPREWHEAIRLAARTKAFQSLMEFDKAAPAENNFVSFIRRKTDPIAEEDAGRIPGSSVLRRRR